jgi:hypothetical protein
MGLREAIIAVICIVMPLTGCQTMRPVDLAGSRPLVAQVKPDEVVRVWLRDGRTLELRVSAVEPDALVGGAQRIPLKDIERLERRDFSWTRTTLLVVGILALAFGILIATQPMAPSWH